MTLASSLSNALSGLRANTKLTEVVSNNLANALTDGFGRQTVNFVSSAYGAQGAGVQVASVTRNNAPELTAARRQADGDAATAAVETDAWVRLGRSLGEATSADGLFRNVEELEASLRALAETPELGPRQNETVEDARDLASALNQLSQEAAIVRQNADASIAFEVETVNRNLSEIDKLNAQIQQLSAQDITAPTLVDKRERLIDEINAILPVKVQQKAHNVVHLYTAEGQFVLQETPSFIGFTKSSIITADMVYDPLGGAALSGLSLRSLDLAPGGQGTQRIKSGSLAGHFAVRDQIGVSFNARIDQFSADLISRFQDPTVDPTLSATDPGLFTDNGAVLDPTTIEGLAGRISLNALVDPSLGGDPTRLRDGLMSVASGPTASSTIPRNLLDALRAERNASTIPGLVGTLSSAQMVAGLTELTGIARTAAENESARLTGTREVLADGEATRIGVDSDAELQELIVIEQAFAANAQVVQAVSRMLQEIVELR